jgi:hypothetical protein
MSDIMKWIQLLSEDSITKGSAVKLSDEYGGGVGTFEQLAEDNPEIAIVNVKGNTQEIPLTSVQKVIAQDSKYGEDPCYNITPELFEPGASVCIKNLYGGGTGDGYGVFIAYSTDGNTAIVNVDSQQRSIPVDLVYPSGEQQAKDEFCSSGGDGSQSPFTSAGNNVQDKGRSNMSDMERWMDAVNTPKTESTIQPAEQVSEDCGCGDYECTTCFPLSEDEINGAMQTNEYESEDEELIELDLDDSDYFDDASEDDMDMDMDMEMPEPDAAVDMAPGNANDEMSTNNDQLGQADASEDVSEILGKIEYIQNLGMSNTDRYYDIDQLMRMRPEAIKRIYNKILGDGGNDIDETSAGGISVAAGRGKVTDKKGVYEEPMMQQSAPELDRMRELSGMSPDDGMQSGNVIASDFKEMFWDYWDKSSSSSQHQYLTTVFGEDARIEDFSDAAAQAIKYITTNTDTGKVDKQLHLLRRIGMPLYSLCANTGEFCPE